MFYGPHHHLHHRPLRFKVHTCEESRATGGPAHLKPPCRRRPQNSAAVTPPGVTFTSDYFLLLRLLHLHPSILPFALWLKKATISTGTPVLLIYEPLVAPATGKGTYKEEKEETHAFLT